MMNKEEYEKKLLNNVIRSCHSEDKLNKIKSIILTGSFGRNEQTYNNNKLKSDIEIGLVYNNCSKKYIKNIAWKVMDMFEEELNIMDMSYKRVKNICNFNNSFYPTKFKTLFTFDLYNGSYTIDGEKIIENINLDNRFIDKYEAKRIVANRIAEYVHLTNTKNNDIYINKQWISKIILSIGSAWLVLNNKYESSYRRQKEILNENISIISKELGDSFIDDYNLSFAFIRENQAEYVTPNKNLYLYVKNIYSLFEKNKLKSSRVNPTSRIMKYIIKFIKSSSSLSTFVHIFNVENYILDNVITGFYNESNINDIAELWYKVLY